MNPRDEEAARWRRRNHADIESMINLMLARIGEVTQFEDFRGVNCPPRVRAFYSALHSAHGGGNVAREPFRRAHLTIAEYLQFEGSEVARVARVRRLLELTEAYQRASGFELVKITRGGGEEHRKTEYVDFLVPVADEAVQRARSSETWKINPGRAKREQIDWALSRLPRVKLPEAELKESNKKLSPLAEYTKRREKLTAAILEYVESVEERDGDGAHELEVIEVELVRARQSLAEKKRARAALDKSRRDEREQREADAGVWEDDGQGRTLTKMLPSPVENLPKTEEKPDMPAAALDYVERRLLPFPLHWMKEAGRCSCAKGAQCESPGKHPRIVEWQKIAAWGNAKMVGGWWRSWPLANVGLLTGEAPGLVVLDFDFPAGGEATLNEWRGRHGDGWLDTAAVRTGGGGIHLYYQYPEGLDIRNSVRKIGGGVDVRANGGYVAAPPSLHASGRRYEWLNDLEPAAMPDWLLKLLTEESPPAAAPAGSKARSQGKSGAGIGLVITEGDRNETLFKIGCSMRGKGAGAAEIEAELSDINARQCSPPLPPAEVQKIARSCATYAANRVAAGG
jgi:hypothetical protein